MLRNLRALFILLTILLIIKNAYCSENDYTTLYIYAIDGSQTMFSTGKLADANKIKNLSSFFRITSKSHYNIKNIIRKQNMLNDNDYFTVVKFGFGNQFQKNKVYKYTSIDDYFDKIIAPQKVTESNIYNALKFLQIRILSNAPSIFFDKLSTRLLSLEYFSTLLTKEYDFLKFNRIILIRISDEIVNSEDSSSSGANDENMDAFAFLDTLGYKSDEKDFKKFYEQIQIFNDLFSYKTHDIDFRKPFNNHIRLSQKELVLKAKNFNNFKPLIDLEFDVISLLDTTFLSIDSKSVLELQTKGNNNILLRIDDSEFQPLDINSDKISFLIPLKNQSIHTIEYGTTYSFDNKFIKGLILHPADYLEIRNKTSKIPNVLNKYKSPKKYREALLKIENCKDSPAIVSELRFINYYLLFLIIVFSIIICLIAWKSFILLIPPTKINSDWTIKSMLIVRNRSIVFKKNKIEQIVIKMTMETGNRKFSNLDIKLLGSIKGTINEQNYLFCSDDISISDINYSKDKSDESKFSSNVSINENNKININLTMNDNKLKLSRGQISFNLIISLDFSSDIYSNPKKEEPFVLQIDSEETKFSIKKNSQEISPNIQIDFEPRFNIPNADKDGIFHQASRGIESQVLGELIITNKSKLYTKLSGTINFYTIDNINDNAIYHNCHAFPTNGMEEFNFEYNFTLNIPFGNKSTIPVEIENFNKTTVKLEIELYLSLDNNKYNKDKRLQKFDYTINLIPPRTIAIYFDKGTSANAIIIGSYNDNGAYAEQGIAEKNEWIPKIASCYGEKKIKETLIPGYQDIYLSTKTFFDFMSKENDQNQKFIDNFNESSKSLFKIPRLNNIVEPENIIPSEKYFMQYKTLPNLWQAMKINLDPEINPKPGYYKCSMNEPNGIEYISIRNENNPNTTNILMEDLYLQTSILFLKHYCDLNPGFYKNTIMSFFISLPNNTKSTVKEKIKRKLVEYYNNECDITFISESDAVALNIIKGKSPENGEQGNLLVIDIGAGTTDLSLMKWSVANQWEVNVLDRFSYNIAGDAIDTLLAIQLIGENNFLVQDKQSLLSIKSFISDEKNMLAIDDDDNLNIADNDFRRKLGLALNRANVEDDPYIELLMTFWQSERVNKYLIQSLKEAIDIVLTQHINDLNQTLDIAIVGRGRELAGYIQKIRALCENLFPNFELNFIIPEAPKSQVVKGLKIFDDIFHNIPQNCITNIDFEEEMNKKFVYGFYCKINDDLNFFFNQDEPIKKNTDIAKGVNEAKLYFFRCPVILAQQYNDKKITKNDFKNSPFCILLGKYPTPRNSDTYSVSLNSNKDSLQLNISGTKYNPTDISEIDFSKNIGFQLSLWPFTDLPK